MNEWSHLLAGACSASRTPGAVMGLRWRGEERVVTFGIADLDTGALVTARTIFPLGSMTKAITAVLAMQQVEAGRIALDEPLAGALPELVLGDPRALNTLTLRHLLSHRAGFFGDILDGPSAGDDALEQYARAGGRLEQVTQPGEAFSYNNAAFAIAGRLTELAAQARWSDLFVNGLARSLGMTRTGVHEGELPDADVAACHVPGPDGTMQALRSPAGSPALAPAGSTPWSCAADVLLLGRLLSGELANGGVAAESLRAMKAWLSGPTSTFASGWGLGLQAFDATGELIGHDGAVAGGQSFLRVAPNEDLTFALFVNGGDGRSVFETLFSRIEEVVGQRLATPVPPWPPASCDVDARHRLGRYAVARYAVTVSANAQNVLSARFEPTAEAGDFSEPLTLEMRPQHGDPTNELFLTRMPTNRLPTQQRFTQTPDGRRFLLFRGRLFPKIEPASTLKKAG